MVKIVGTVRTKILQSHRNIIPRHHGSTGDTVTPMMTCRSLKIGTAARFDFGESCYYSSSNTTNADDDLFGWPRGKIACIAMTAACSAASRDARAVTGLQGTPPHT